MFIQIEGGFPFNGLLGQLSQFQNNSQISNESIGNRTDLKENWADSITEEKQMVKKIWTESGNQFRISKHPYPFNLDHEYIVNLATPKKKKQRTKHSSEELKCGQWNEGHTRKFGLLQLVAKWHCCNVRAPLLCYRRRRWRAAGNKGRSCLLCYGEYLKGSAKNKKLTTWKKEKGKWTKKAMANI